MAANNRLIRVDPDVIEPYPTEFKFSEVPLDALRLKARSMLSGKLNPPKILPTEEGLPRDWRGVLYCSKVGHHESSFIYSKADPMANVLELWTCSENSHKPNFSELVAALEVIDRYDIIDDIKETLEEDAKFYIITKHEKALRNITEVTAPPRTANIDEDILTIDDIRLKSLNLPLQQYDAFILHADEDTDFAAEIISNMEAYGLKLCDKDRDLIPSVTFEHEALIRLISERCNHLIVILSPAFITSQANRFIVTYTQAEGIALKRRNLIPCVYKDCEIPITLRHYFHLKYQQSSRLFNFWEKLRVTIQNPSVVTAPNLTLPNITITEADPSTPLTSKSNSTITIQTIETKDDSDGLSIGTPTSHLPKIACSQSAQDIIQRLSDENRNPQLARAIQSCASSDSQRQRIMPPRPRLRNSASMVNLLDTPSNGTLMCSNPSLTGSMKSVESAKKMKWYKKILSPNSGSNTDINVKEKTKRKWYRKKVASCS